jgi:hypothetical protein
MRMKQGAFNLCIFPPLALSVRADHYQPNQGHLETISNKAWEYLRASVPFIIAFPYFLNELFNDSP